MKIGAITQPKPRQNGKVEWEIISRIGIGERRPNNEIVKMLPFCPRRAAACETTREHRAGEEKCAASDARTCRSENQVNSKDFPDHLHHILHALHFFAISFFPLSTDFE